MVRILLFILFAFSLLVHPANAGGVGTTSADWLRLGLGTRASALGGNFTGGANDVSAMYYNPAGLAGQTKRQIDTMRMNYIADISYFYVGGVYPLGNDQTVGAYYGSLQTPAIPITTIGNPSGAGSGTFTDSASVINLSYARKMGDQLKLGVSGKLINENLAGDTAGATAFDVGVLYEDFMPNLSLGFAFQNFGIGQLRNTPIGTNMKAGAKYHMNDTLDIYADVNRPLEDQFYYGLGAEYWVMPTLAIRGGFNTLSGISLGVGLKWTAIYFNYAYVPYGDLGDSHRLALTYDFDFTSKEQKELEAIPVQPAPETKPEEPKPDFINDKDLFKNPVATEEIETIIKDKEVPAEETPAKSDAPADKPADKPTDQPAPAEKQDLF
jgi:hypothetical protein